MDHSFKIDRESEDVLLSCHSYDRENSLFKCSAFLLHMAVQQLKSNSHKQPEQQRSNQHNRLTQQLIEPHTAL